MEAISSSELSGSVRTIRITTPKNIFFTHIPVRRIGHDGLIPNPFQSSNHLMSYSPDADIVVKKSTKKREKRKLSQTLQNTKAYYHVHREPASKSNPTHTSPATHSCPLSSKWPPFRYSDKNFMLHVPPISFSLISTSS